MHRYYRLCILDWKPVMSCEQPVLQVSLITNMTKESNDLIEFVQCVQLKIVSSN